MASTVETPEEAEKRKRREREALLLLFFFLIQDTRHTLTRAVMLYLAGTLAFGDLSDALASTLTDAHAHAAYLGRRLAGARGPFGAADRQFGATIAFEQAGYLQGLLHDLESGRYAAGDDGELPGDLANRIRLYVLRCRGTALEAWSLALPPDTLINWVLGPNTNHCPSCPQFAAGSPYRADSLPTTPGSADCICLSACKCHLETLGGATAFPVPEGV